MARQNKITLINVHLALKLWVFSFSVPFSASNYLGFYEDFSLFRITKYVSVLGIKKLDWSPGGSTPVSEMNAGLFKLFEEF